MLEGEEVDAMCENQYVLERALEDRLREARQRAATRQRLSEASGASHSPPLLALRAPAGWPGAGHGMRRWLRSLVRVAIVEPRGAGQPRGAGEPHGAAASRSR
jgi:hypothetical protein